MFENLRRLTIYVSDASVLESRVDLDLLLFHLLLLVGLYILIVPNHAFCHLPALVQGC